MSIPAGHVSNPQMLTLLKTPIKMADKGQGHFGSQQAASMSSAGSSLVPRRGGSNPGSTLTSFRLLRQDLCSCTQQCWVMHLHRSLCNQGQEEVHVINEVLKIGVGQVLWLVSASCCFVSIDVNYPILHLNVVSQVLSKIPSFKGILSILHRWCEHWTKRRIL